MGSVLCDLKYAPPSGGHTKNVKIAENDTQVSVPGDELANRAEHFDIPAYDSDQGSGEEGIYELGMEKA